MISYLSNIDFNFSKNRILVSVSFAVFFVAASIVTVQKFFVFGGNEQYQVLRSALYNFLIFVPFGFWIIPSIKFQERITRIKKRPYTLKIIILTLGLLISYPFVINIILFTIGLSSELLSSSFLTKYFTGVIQVHISVLLLIQLLFYLSEKRHRTQESVSQSKQSDLGLSSAVLWIESFDHYAKIHYKERTTLERISLKKLEERLPENFIRIHRKYIVNLEGAGKLYRKKRVLYLEINGVSLRVSRSKEEKVQKMYSSRQNLTIGDK